MIVALSTVTSADVALVGGKAANLGELIAAGLPVPPGFCVTTAAYREAITPMASAIDDAVREGRPEDASRLVTAAPVPSSLGEQVAAALAELGGVPVAVRSSATAEDLAEASFAGQQETFLGMRGTKAVLDAARRCWASMWSERAVAYRDRHGFGHADVDVAVVVQRMVPASAAGVLFTCDPVTGRDGDTVIEGSWGVGESVVSGAVTPDTFTVREGRIEHRAVGTKATRIDLDSTGGTTLSEVPPADR